MKHSPTQPPLFEADAALVPQPAKPVLSPAQRKFQKLSAEIEQGRVQLRELQELLPRLQARSDAELVPLYERITALRVARIKAVDAALAAGVKLGRRQREDVVDWLIEECDDLLCELAEPDPDLVTIYDRHADERWQDMDAERADIDREISEDIARAHFGDEITEGLDPDDPDDLIRRIAERLAQGANEQVDRAQAGTGTRAGRKPNKREQQRQAKAEREAKEASQSVRDIYRKLASALHPDRESDPVRRAERTALMQRVNIAYEAQDLLGLLNLQHEVEGLAGIDASALPEERLGVFIRVLGEQRDAIRREIFGIVQYLAMAAGEPGRFQWTARENEADFERHLREVRDELKQLEREVTRASGRATMKDYLRELVERMRSAPDPDYW
jgi:hypothetical protein